MFNNPEEKINKEHLINKKTIVCQTNECSLLFNFKKLMIKMLNNIDTSLYKGVILINKIDNDTCLFINTNKILKSIENIIINNSNTFKLINKKKIKQLKKRIKLSSQDNLLSRNKIFFISKKIGVKYVLFSKILGDINSIAIHIELITVNNHEIIWNDTRLILKK